jgi:phosphatidylinositol alpha-1,6-mannosyltransferase
VQTLPAAAVAAGRRPIACMLYGSELWSPSALRTFTACRRHVDRFVAISKFTATAAVAAGADAARVAVAPPGADARPLPTDATERLAAIGLEDGCPFLLTVGRLAEPHKGQDMVIRTLAPLLAREPRLRYVIAGDGPLRPYLLRIAATSGVADAVLMPGSVDEGTKAALLSRCMALVMISREARAAAQFEGFGVVFAEAALHGRPSIGGDSGAIPDAIRDGETGLLVDPERADSLVAAVLQLLEDSGFADELGKRARERAQAEFTWDAASERIERVLAELVR